MNGRFFTIETRVGAVGIVLGPLLMSIGDAVHPAESWDARAQIEILTEGAARWHLAHLLLFVGALVFIPGILALTRMGATRKPGAAYAARVLMLMSIGGWAAVLGFEMVLGTFLVGGAELGTAVELMEAFQSPQVFLPILAGVLAFFVGTGFLVWSLGPLTPPTRWPGLLLALGASLILAEIVSARVLLSQIGNVSILIAGIFFSRLLLEAGDRGQHAAPGADDLRSEETAGITAPAVSTPSTAS